MAGLALASAARTASVDADDFAQGARHKARERRTRPQHVGLIGLGASIKEGAPRLSATSHHVLGWHAEHRADLEHLVFNNIARGDQAAFDGDCSTNTHTSTPT